MTDEDPLSSPAIPTATSQEQTIGSAPASSVQPGQSFSIPRKPVGNEAERGGGDRESMQSSESEETKDDYKRPAKRSSFLTWWLPEIFASVVSVACLMCIFVVLYSYDGRALDDLNFPAGLTLNGILALIATINRVALMAPVGSALSQEAWLWFAPAAQQNVCHSTLADLERSNDASRGAWGSLKFLLCTRRRYVIRSACLFVNVC
jgi:hypothetical protein